MLLLRAPLLLEDLLGAAPVVLLRAPQLLLDDSGNDGNGSDSKTVVPATDNTITMIRLIKDK